ncbi:MAG: class II fructose-bisphosphate aldolase [Peptoniphilaceae bacterium]|nr:class II fructose-bisphosphate aldolase [Peptoniphilaceae bacterium]
MLVTMKELLEKADQENYAVGAFNCATLENVRSIVQAAEEMSQPVILQYAQAHEKFISLEEMGSILLYYARKSRLPIAVHFDHGTSLKAIQAAIDLGFSSVMIDASSKDYEENVRLTKEVVRMAKAKGVTVEAELGHVFNSSIGAGEGAVTDSQEDYEDLDQIYTNPSDAKDFVGKTGVDCLAIAFGTVHGIYLSKPHLDLERIKQVKDQVQIPLVMHGGSGVSEEDYWVAIENGIRKVNYYTYANKAGAKAVVNRIQGMDEKETILYDELSLLATGAMRDNVKEAIRMFSHR